MSSFTARFGREVAGLFNYFLPPACALCLERLSPPAPDHFCRTCLSQIPELKANRCPRCALPYPAEEGHGHLCKTCLAERKPLFTEVTAIGSHDGLLREAIHRLKFRGDINLDRPLAHLLSRKLTEENVTPDLVVPVPLHKQKMRQRSYNQSALLAIRIARNLNCRVAPNLLLRTEPGQPQQTLSASERVRNIKGAFTLQQDLDGESVLLVDDVMTTGATARECARTLLKGGVASVRIAVIARAALR